MAEEIDKKKSDQLALKDITPHLNMLLMYYDIFLNGVKGLDPFSGRVINGPWHDNNQLSKGEMNPFTYTACPSIINLLGSDDPAYGDININYFKIQPARKFEDLNDEFDYKQKNFKDAINAVNGDSFAVYTVSREQPTKLLTDYTGIPDELKDRSYVSTLRNFFIISEGANGYKDSIKYFAEGDQEEINNITKQIEEKRAATVKEINTLISNLSNKVEAWRPVYDKGITEMQTLKDKKEFIVNTESQYDPYWNKGIPENSEPDSEESSESSAILSGGLKEQLKLAQIDPAKAMMGAVGLDSMIGNTATALGAAAAPLLVSATILPQVPALMQQIASEAVMAAAAKIQEVLMEEVTKITAKVVSMPSDIMKEAGKVTAEKIKKPGDYLKAFNSNTEDLLKSDETKMAAEALEKKVTDIKKKIDKVKKIPEDILKWVNTNVTPITEMIYNGPQAIEDAVNAFVGDAGNVASQQIRTALEGVYKEIEDFTKKQGKTIGTFAAEEINKLTAETAKATFDKINEVKNTAITVAKAAIGKALLNMMAALGL